MLNMITWYKEWDYMNIIREYLLIELKFIKNKEYVTLENNFILWAMWIKV